MRARFVAVAAFLVGGVFLMTKNQTARGVALNNPGNIKRNPANAWRGAAPVQLDDTFETFTGPEYGYRAMVRTLRTYYRDHGLTTVRGIITRWAPPFENPTGSYVDTVAGRLGVDPDATIDLESVLPQLLDAMTKVEQGQAQPWGPDAPLLGIALA